VSSNLKAPTAAAGTTRSGAKRKASSPKSSKKRAKKQGKEKYDLSKLEEEEVMDQEQESGQPKLMTGAIMRDYQKQGVAWLTSLWENGMNGILGDEMGLGKTIQTIGMMSNLKEKNVKGPFLVVAPLSTLANWNREVPQWTEGKMSSMLYHGSQEKRAELRLQWGTTDVIVTSFEICMRDIKFFQNPKFSNRTAKEDQQWKYLAVDEGHRLKNKDCRLIRELKTINSANRLLLTGTPLQNDLTELWALLNFLLPNIFDDLRSFQKWFDFDQNAMGDSDRIIAAEASNKMVSKLHTILRPFLLRRQKKDVDLVSRRYGLPCLASLRLVSDTRALKIRAASNRTSRRRKRSFCKLTLPAARCTCAQL
jgi:ATP-dependent DNA helicase